MTILVYLPPEVCGALSVAQKHVDASRRLYWTNGNNYKRKVRIRRHEEKAQKLVARAARLLRGKELL